MNIKKLLKNIVSEVSDAVHEWHMDEVGIKAGVARLQEEMACVRAENSKLKECNNELLVTVAKLSAQLGVAEGRCLQAKGDNSELTWHRAELLKKTEYLTYQVHKVQEETKGLYEQLGESKKNYDFLLKDTGKLTEQVCKAHDELRTSQRECASLREGRDNLSTLLDSSHRDYEILRVENTRLSALVTDMSRKFRPRRKMPEGWSVSRDSLNVLSVYGPRLSYIIQASTIPAIAAYQDSFDENTQDTAGITAEKENTDD